MESTKLRRQFLAATKQLITKLSSVIDNCAKEVEQDGAVRFSHKSYQQDKGVRQATRPVLKEYTDWLTAVGVKNRKEMDELLASFGDDSEVLKCAEDLKKEEQRFDAFMKQVDAVVQQDEDKVTNYDTIILYNNRLVLKCRAALFKPCRID